MKIIVLNLKVWIRVTKALASICLILATVIFFGAPTVKGIKAVYASNEPSAKQIIVIDAGHGGEDPGAIGVNGCYEKDLNLSIATELGEQLKEKGFNVVYTRTEDKMMYSPEENIKGFRKLSDLKNRVAIANGIENVLLISIHQNSYGDGKYSGLQVYYKDGDKKSEALAESVQAAVKNQLQPNNTRSIKRGEGIYLLEKSSGSGILIECGFLTNAEECEKLSKKEYQKQLSFSIVCGIIEYIEKTS